MARAAELDFGRLSVDELSDIGIAATGVLCRVLKIKASRVAVSIERVMAGAITSAWKGAARDALYPALEKLQAGPHTEARVNDFLRSLNMGLKDPLNPKQQEIVEARLAEIYKVSKAEAAHDARARYAFGQPDEKAIAASGNQQMFWVKGFYSDQLSQRVSAVSRDVILEQGLSHREAGSVLMKSLRQELGLSAGAGPSEFAQTVPARYAGNPEFYFQQVASVSGHQSRIFGKMNAYDEAGVTMAQLINPMDERTGSICKQLNGQVFPLPAGMSLMNNLINAKTPEKVQDVAPFPQPASLEDALGGAKVGSKGATKTLINEGVLLPPFHPLCRTEVVIKETGGGGRPAPEKPEQPAEQPKPEKPKPAPQPPPAPEVVMPSAAARLPQVFPSSVNPNDFSLGELRAMYQQHHDLSDHFAADASAKAYKQAVKALADAAKSLQEASLRMGDGPPVSPGKPSPERIAFLDKKFFLQAQAKRHKEQVKSLKVLRGAFGQDKAFVQAVRKEWDATLMGEVGTKLPEDALNALAAQNWKVRAYTLDEYKKMGHSDAWGLCEWRMANGQGGIISRLSTVPAEHRTEVMVHEFAHGLDAATSKGLSKYLAQKLPKTEYVSRYAKKNDVENLAETITMSRVGKSYHRSIWESGFAKTAPERAKLMEAIFKTQDSFRRAMVIFRQFGTSQITADAAEAALKKLM